MSSGPTRENFSLFRLILTVIIVLWPLPAWPQTAEETVLFLFYGYEHGKHWPTGEYFAFGEPAKNLKDQ
jgi:hypothetical protein